LLCSYEAKLSAISTGDEVSSMVDEEGVVEVSLKVMQDVLQRMRHSSDTMAGYRGLLVFMLVGLPPSPAHTPVVGLPPSPAHTPLLLASSNAVTPCSDQPAAMQFPCESGSRSKL
jgi:hypothetical protein